MNKSIITRGFTKNYTNNERGFTLIEIITTIVMLGIISLTVFTIYNFFFVTAFESMNSSNKQSTIMDIDGTIKSEMLVFDVYIDISEDGNLLSLGETVFEYDEAENKMTVIWPDDENTYYNIYPIETSEGPLPIFQKNNERLMLNFKIEDRHETIEFSNQYIIRNGRYDKTYFIDD